MDDNGMGCVAKAFQEAEARKDSKMVSVMLGNWEIDPSRLDNENQINLGEGKFGIVLETKMKKVDAKNNPVLHNGEIIFDHVVMKKLSLGASKPTLVTFIKEMQVLMTLYSSDE